MSDLLGQVERAIIDPNLLLPGERVLVGVSGGLDSMVLLHLLRQLSQTHRWSLIVAHFNHQLRGAASDADEDLVRRTAREAALCFRGGQADVNAFARKHHLSIEMAARQLRHRFLARTAAALGISKVALAHHADDQVELFFLRLLRGAGPEGLTGMKWRSPSPADPCIQIVRPLLGLSKEALGAFAAEENIQFRHDATNDALDYPRNKIRQELLPYICENLQPGLNRTVLRLMELLRAESELVEQCICQQQQRHPLRFEQLHVAAQRRRLRSECLRLAIPADYDLIEGLRVKPGRILTVSPSLGIWRDSDGQVHSRQSRPVRFKPAKAKLELTAKAGHVEFGSVNIRWRVKPWRQALDVLKNRPEALERFDADKVGSTLILRHWAPGDRFQPIGMCSPAKVQDLFTNLKVAQPLRVKLVLATNSSGEIFWIEGLRISERFKIEARTRRCLEWRWQREV